MAEEETENEEQTEEDEDETVVEDKKEDKKDDEKCSKDGSEGSGSRGCKERWRNLQPQDDEQLYLFYLKLAKPFVLNLPEFRDRINALLWIKKIQGEDLPSVRSLLVKMELPKSVLPEVPTKREDLMKKHMPRTVETKSQGASPKSALKSPSSKTGSPTSRAKFDSDEEETGEEEEDGGVDETAYESAEEEEGPPPPTPKTVPTSKQNSPRSSSPGRAYYGPYEPLSTPAKLVYLKSLLFMLHRKRLVGPFNRTPDDKNLKELNKKYQFPQLYRVFLAEVTATSDVAILIEGYENEEWLNYNAAYSSDLKEYAASQVIPNFGSHLYYATSPDPVSVWSHTNLTVLPKPILTYVATKIECPPTEKLSSSHIHCYVPKERLPKAVSSGEKYIPETDLPCFVDFDICDSKGEIMKEEIDIYTSRRLKDNTLINRHPPLWSSNLINAGDRNRPLFRHDRSMYDILTNGGLNVASDDSIFATEKMYYDFQRRCTCRKTDPFYDVTRGIPPCDLYLCRTGPAEGAFRHLSTLTQAAKLMGGGVADYGQLKYVVDPSEYGRPGSVGCPRHSPGRSNTDFMGTTVSSTNMDRQIQRIPSKYDSILDSAIDTEYKSPNFKEQIALLRKRLGLKKKKTDLCFSPDYIPNAVLKQTYINDFVHSRPSEQTVDAEEKIPEPYDHKNMGYETYNIYQNQALYNRHIEEWLPTGMARIEKCNYLATLRTISWSPVTTLQFLSQCITFSKCLFVAFISLCHLLMFCIITVITWLTTENRRNVRTIKRKN